MEEPFSNVLNATLYGIYPIKSVENYRERNWYFYSECWTDGLPVYRDSVGHVVIDNNASTFLAFFQVIPINLVGLLQYF